MFKNSFSDLGHKKDAKEWQMMVLPVHPKNAELLIKYPNCRHCMSEKDILGLTTLHIQIREEIRLEKLVKGHRSLEVTFPLARNNKRKDLQVDIMHAIRKKMKTMSQEQLEEFYSKLDA